jgi:hypothetical protein
MKSTLFVVNLLFVALLAQFTNCDLRFAWEIFRHGARAPESGLDAHHNDIFGEHWDSPGELTPTGMRMHFLLGHRNRLRYKTFLSNSFKAEEVYVRSSDYNRTMMSVQSQLQGLFPPSTGAKLDQRQANIAVPPTNDHDYKSQQAELKDKALPGAEQIFPVHLWVQQNPMHFFFYNPFICNPLKGVFGKNQSGKRFTTWFEKFEKTWGPSLRKALDITDVNYFALKNYMNVFKVMDHFVADYTEGRKLEKLTKAGIDLAKFNETAYEFHKNDILYNYNGVGADQTYAIISMSVLLPEVIDWMQNRIDADISGNEGNINYKLPKFTMFSTHDVTLGSALSYIQPLFKLQTYYYTPFASSLFFELYRDDHKKGAGLKADDYNVQIIFNDHNMATIKFPEFKAKILGGLWSRDKISEYCGWGPKATSFAFLKKN